MGLRQYLRAEPEPSPLRKSLRTQGGIRALVEAQRRTHDETTWGYYDHDDPGEEAGAAANAHAIVDQGPKVARPHRPGYHADGYRKPVEKSGHRKERGPKKLSDRRIPKDERLSDDAHRSPPKGYPKDRRQYADPAAFKYPIDTQEHVAAAIRYLSKRKDADDYTPSERRAMWARIRRAAQHFGVHVSAQDGRKRG